MPPGSTNRNTFLLVRAGDLSMEQIARRLGYADAASFTRAFKRWTGTTPTAFRDG